MDFAKKQLEKFGWKEGTGLGKNEQGILSAIKPTLKVGKEGMGFDLSKELVDTWWTRAYDDSLKRINIDNDSSTNETVGVTLKGDEDDGESGSLSKEQGSSAERPFQKMRKRMMKASFPTFSKGATLTNGELLVEKKTSDSGDDSEDDKSKSNDATKSLTDEELFKACGGRTLHKAARFGLKLNGKLARIAAQEEATKSFLSKYATLKKAPTAKVPFSNPDPEQGDTLSKKELKKKKKKSKKEKAERADEDQTVPSTSASPSSDSEVPVNADDITEEADVIADQDSKKKKKKDKKRKYEALEQEETLQSTATNDQLAKEDTISKEEEDEPSIKNRKKKSKKHKKSKYNKDNVDDEECCALLSS